MLSNMLFSNLNRNKLIKISIDHQSLEQIIIFATKTAAGFAPLVAGLYTSARIYSVAGAIIN